MDIFKPDFKEMQEKISADAMSSDLYQRAISYADKTLDVELPDKPFTVFSDPCMKDGRFTPEFLVHLQVYDEVSWLFERAFTALAFAYKMTGNHVYLEKWLQCVDSCFLNSVWGPDASKYDHCSSRLCRALSISAAWLENDIPEEVHERIDLRLGIEVDGFIDTYARSGDMYPLGPNDHQSKSVAGAGTAALYLSERGFKDRKADMDRLVFLFEKLLPETVTPEGGWIDGYDFYYYAMMDCVFFLDLLKVFTGRDLIFHPGMREAAVHSLYALGTHSDINVTSPYVFFWLQDRYEIPAVNVAEHMLSQGTFEDQHAPYAFMFYQTEPVPTPLADSAHVAMDFGLGRLGKGYNNKSVYLWMRSGPAEAFCRNNQNGLLLTAYGKRILYNTVMVKKVGYVKLWDIVYEHGLWLTGKSTSLMVNGQDQLKNRYGEDWEPIKKFHKPGRPKWDDDTMWWFDYEEPKEALGRFIGASDTGNAQFMSASADKVFGTAVSRYTRHCAMLDQNLIVIVDCLQAESGAEIISFRGNTPCKFSQTNGQIDINADNEAYAAISFAATSDLEITCGIWEFQPDTGGYFTAEFGAKQGLNILITTIQCDKNIITAQRKVNLKEENDRWSVRITQEKNKYSLSLPENPFEGLLNATTP